MKNRRVRFVEHKGSPITAPAAEAPLPCIRHTNRVRLQMLAVIFGNMCSHEAEVSRVICVKAQPTSKR